MDNNTTKTEVFVPEAAPKVDAKTIVRLLVLVVAMVNAVAAMFGKQLNLEVDQELWYNIVSALLVIGAGVWAAWKDNNITKQARISAEVAKQVTNK